MKLRGIAAFSAVLLCLVGMVAAQGVKNPGPPKVLEDHEQYVSYWTLEPNWHSELQLRNTSPTTDLLVYPSLRATDGSETPLSEVLVHPNEVVDVNLHEAVMYSAKQPSSLLGSVVLRYKAETQGILYAAMMVHRESRPIAFHIDAMGKFTEDKDYLREGVWWLPNDKVSDYLVLTNQGDDRMPLVLSIFDAQGHAYQKELVLLPRETSRLSVRDLAQAGHLTGDFGGVQVHALAHARALDTLHILFDEKAGFSATLKMFDHDPSALVRERDFAKKGSWTIRAPMLALAQPDPALLLPAFTELEPRILLRNTTQNPVVANMTFNWRSSASTGKTQGPTIRLKALETRMIKLSDLPSSEAPPSGAHWATVSIATDGPPDGVVAVAASYNSALTYGAQSPFSDQLSSFWKGGEWLADANHDSIITVGNASLKPMKARFSLLYSHGTAHYDVEQALDPDEQMWVDVGEIIRTGKPDANGAVLPKDLASGSYQFQDLTNKAVGALYEGKVIYDVSSGHVTYGCAVNCCNRSVYLNYNPLSVAITLTFTNGVSGNDTCGDDGENLSGDFWNWSTVNPSIATTTKGGTHTGIALGSTTSSTYGQVERPNGRFGCINFTPEPTGNTNVPPLVSITNLQYTNSLSVWQDGPSNPNPVAMSQTVWTGSADYPSVFVSGNSISATATFSVTPPSSTAIAGASITGNVTGLGQLTATGINIPAGADSISVTLSGNSAFPSSTTQYYSGLGITWFYSQTGQTCSSGADNCQSAGSTSSPVYVTLASPSGLSESVMPLTAVKLAIGSGGATTQTTAWQSTWQQFAGPANVTGWDGRLLYYYEQGVPFSACATSSVGLLTQSNGSGQCGSWARLLMDALAVNGISSSFTTVTPSAANEMLVKNWSFSASPTYPSNAPWEYRFTPVIESQGYGMVPLPSNSLFGDLTSISGLPGQNSPTPSEKFFGRHFVVKAPSGLSVGGPYFDPSYGATYSNACSFESTAVAGYANLIAGTNNFYVEKPTGACNVTLVP